MHIYTYTHTYIQQNHTRFATERQQPRPPYRRDQEEGSHLGELRVEDSILMGQGPCRDLRQ